MALLLPSNLFLTPTIRWEAEQPTPSCLLSRISWRRPRVRSPHPWVAAYSTCLVLCQVPCRATSRRTCRIHQLLPSSPPVRRKGPCPPYSEWYPRNLQRCPKPLLVDCNPAILRASAHQPQDLQLRLRQ